MADFIDIVDSFTSSSTYFSSATGLLGYPRKGMLEDTLFDGRTGNGVDFFVRGGIGGGRMAATGTFFVVDL